MMTRRGWFASLFAPVVARFIPKPVPTLDYPAYGDAFRNGILGDAINDDYKIFVADFFVPSPFLYSIRNASMQSFDVGTMISEPLIYAPATEPTKQVGQTIHNPPFPVSLEDGAN